MTQPPQPVPGWPRGYDPAPGYGPPVSYSSPGYGPAVSYGPPLSGGPSPGLPTPDDQAPIFKAGDAFSWAWHQFSKNAAALIIPLIAYPVAVAGLLAATYWLANAVTTTERSTGGHGHSQLGPDWYTYTTEQFGIASKAVFAVGYFLALALVFYARAAYVSGCLDIADGKPVRIGSFFRARNLSTVIVTALLLAILTVLASSVLIVPGIIFGFAAQFTLAFVVDRSLSPLRALKASFATVKDNIGGALLAGLLRSAVLLVGWLACAVGSIVAIPIATLIHIYTYRRLSGGHVAALAPGENDTTP